LTSTSIRIKIKEPSNALTIKRVEEKKADDLDDMLIARVKAGRVHVETDVDDPLTARAKHILLYKELHKQEGHYISNTDMT